MAERKHDLDLFNLVIDSKIRGSDELMKIKVSDISNARAVMSRAMVIQQKTGRPVQFEITECTREAISDWNSCRGLTTTDFVFPSRVAASPHISTRHYARIVEAWVKDVGLDSALYGTHTLRRTKSTLIYKRTHNLRAVQLLLGHTKLESTVRYLGIKVDDAQKIAERTEIWDLHSAPRSGAGLLIQRSNIGLMYTDSYRRWLNRTVVYSSSKFRRQTQFGQYQTLRVPES